MNEFEFYAKILIHHNTVNHVKLHFSEILVLRPENQVDVFKGEITNFPLNVKYHLHVYN